MSTLVAQNISNGTVSTSSQNVIQGSAKAWVNFNGTNGAIRSSYNVSSVTKNGTGDYTVNFTNALANVNYAQLVSAGSFSDSGSFTATASTGTQATTSCRPQISAYNVGTVRFDFQNVCVGIFSS